MNHINYLSCFLTITILFNLQAMEKSLREQIADLSSAHTFSLTEDEEILVQQARNTMSQELSLCTSEHDVYNWMKGNYTNATNNLQNFLQTNGFIISPSDIFGTWECIKEIDEQYKKNIYNASEQKVPIQKNDTTVFWNNTDWPDTKLIPNEKLALVRTVADYLNINPNCFITVQTPKLRPDAIMSIHFSHTFILNLSEETILDLTENPLRCLHILLHEFVHLKNGDGEKNKLLMSGIEYKFLNGGLKHIMYPTLPEAIAQWRYWLELHADIESIIHPHQNRFFKFAEKQIFYQSALMRLGLKSSTLDHISPKIMLRIQMLVKLYDLVNEQIENQFKILNYKIFSYK